MKVAKARARFPPFLEYIFLLLVPLHIKKYKQYYFIKMLTRASVVVPRKVPRTPQKAAVTPLQKLETISGRLAMQGTLWTGIDYLMYHETLSEQIADPKIAMMTAVVTGLVAAGSAATINEIGEREYLYWKTDPETVNGRLAMVAIKKHVGTS
jgi:hypothetical protein